MTRKRRLTSVQSIASALQSEGKPPVLGPRLRRDSQGTPQGGAKATRAGPEQEAFVNNFILEEQMKFGGQETAVVEIRASRLAILVSVKAVFF